MKEIFRPKELEMELMNYRLKVAQMETIAIDDSRRCRDRKMKCHNLKCKLKSQVEEMEQLLKEKDISRNEVATHSVALLSCYSDKINEDPQLLQILEYLKPYILDHSSSIVLLRTNFRKSMNLLDELTHALENLHNSLNKSNKLKNIFIEHLDFSNNLKKQKLPDNYAYCEDKLQSIIDKLNSRISSIEKTESSNREHLYKFQSETKDLKIRIGIIKDYIERNGLISFKMAGVLGIIPLKENPTSDDINNYLDSLSEE